MPHPARNARKAQKRIIRISSPADDCSKIRLTTSRRPDILLPEYRRRSLTYFLEREETPNPQGQLNLKCSTALSLSGSPCSSQDTSNEPKAHVGKGNKNGWYGMANGKRMGQTGGVNVREKWWRCGLLLAILIAPEASVSSPGYLTTLRRRVRSFGKPRMALANMPLAEKLRT